MSRIKKSDSRVVILYGRKLQSEEVAEKLKSELWKCYGVPSPEKRFSLCELSREKKKNLFYRIEKRLALME